MGLKLDKIKDDKSKKNETTLGVMKILRGLGIVEINVELMRDDTRNIYEDLTDTTVKVHGRKITLTMRRDVRKHVNKLECNFDDVIEKIEYYLD